MIEVSVLADRRIEAMGFAYRSECFRWPSLVDNSEGLGAGLAQARQ